MQRTYRFPVGLCTVFHSKGIATKYKEESTGHAVLATGLLTPVQRRSAIFSASRPHGHQPPARFHSCQYALHHLSMHVNQPVVPALILVGQTRVVDPQAMQKDLVEIVQAHGVLEIVIRVIVGYGRVDAAVCKYEMRNTKLQVCCLWIGRGMG